MDTHQSHFRPGQLAMEWGVCADTVRRWCEEVGGFLAIDRPERMHKRGYKSIRIPRATADEIYRRHFVTKR